MRRGFHRLGKAAISVVGLLDVLGMVVVGFVVGKIPGLSAVAEQPWFSSAVVVLGVGFLAFYTALMSSAEIQSYLELEERRASEFERQYVSTLGDIRGLMEQVEALEGGKEVPTRKITQRWAGWELVHPVLDSIDRVSDRLGAILQVSHNSNQVRDCATALRGHCDEATKRVQQVYESHHREIRSAAPPSA